MGVLRPLPSTLTNTAYVFPPSSGVSHWSALEHRVACHPVYGSSQHSQGPYFLGSTCESESSCPRSNFLNFGKSHFRWMTLTIADLVQKVALLELGMTSPELGIMRFTVANDCESSECWQHIVSGTVMMAKEINISKNPSFFLYVLSKSWCYWWWEWSPNK